MSYQKKLVLPNPTGYVDEIARYSHVNYFEWGMPRPIKSTFDTYSDKLFVVKGLKPIIPDSNGENEFCFVPIDLPLEEWKVVVILECFDVKDNPEIEIILEEPRVIKLHKGNTKELSNGYLTVKRLIMLIPLGSVLEFIHRPLPSLRIQPRELRVGSWDPKTAKDRTILSPEVQIFSNLH